MIGLEQWRASIGGWHSGNLSAIYRRYGSRRIVRGWSKVLPIIDNYSAAIYYFVYWLIVVMYVFLSEDGLFVTLSLAFDKNFGYSDIVSTFIKSPASAAMVRAGRDSLKCLRVSTKPFFSQTCTVQWPHNLWTFASPSTTAPMLRLLLALNWLLIVAGDVELNPGPLPMTEYKKLQQERDTIIQYFVDQKITAQLADKLLGAEFITRAVYDQAKNFAPNVMERDRVTVLFDAVLASVMVNSSKYSKFLSILKEIQGLGDIVDFLEGGHGSDGGIGDAGGGGSGGAGGGGSGAGMAVAGPAVISRPDAFTKTNLSKIQGKFGKLVRIVQKKFQELDKDDLFLFLSCILSPEVMKCLPQSSDLKDIFKAIAFNRLWSFLDYNLLEQIIEEFWESDQELTGRMEQYKADLSSYQTATKLKDHIAAALQLDAETSTSDSDTYDPEYFKELSIKLDEPFSKHTLDYLFGLWTSLKRLLRLPPLTLLLHKIHKGCICVTWLIPTHLTPQATERARQSVKFFEDYPILRVIINDELVYEVKPIVLDLEGKTSHVLAKETSPSSATPLAPLSPPTPLEESEQKNFDMISALLDAGVPHIILQILHCLDSRSVVKSAQVSDLWRKTVTNSPIWKYLVKKKTDCSMLWRTLFQRRGWFKYLDVSKESDQFYQDLYIKASRDIHSLETNWRSGRYTLTKIETGSAVLCLQYDDNKIVTGHDDSKIKIWDRITLQVSLELKGHTNIVYCLQYDKKVVISGSRDRTVKVWDIQTGEILKNLLHHKDTIRSLKFTTKTLVTGSLDQTVAVWDIKSHTDITLRTVLEGQVWSAWYAVELSETNVIAGSLDNTIKVWDNFTGGLVRTLSGHEGTVKSLQLRGSHLISGSVDSTVRIWNILSGECLRVLHGHNNSVSCVAMDDKRILSGSEDKTIKVWDLAAALDSGSSGDALYMTTLKEHTDSVRGLQFDHFQLISGSYDKTILVYDFLNRCPVPPILIT